MAAGLRHPVHLSKAGDVVVEMLDDVERGGDIECLVRVRKRLRQPLADLQVLFAAELESVVRDIDTLSLAELREHFEIGTGSATNIKNFAIFDLRFAICSQLAKEHFEDGSAAYEPPMAILHAVHDRVGVLLHLLR